MSNPGDGVHDVVPEWSITDVICCAWDFISLFSAGIRLKRLILKALYAFKKRV